MSTFFRNNATAIFNVFSKSKETQRKIPPKIVKNVVKAPQPPMKKMKQTSLESFFKM